MASLPPFFPSSLSAARRPGGLDNAFQSIIKFLGMGSVLSSFIPGLGDGNFGSSQLSSSLKLFLLGTLIESGRRFWQWMLRRFKPKFSITAKFPTGDPIHEWIVMFLTERGVWQRSLEYTIRYQISNKRWGASVDIPESPANEQVKDKDKDKTKDEDEGINYYPDFQIPRLFRWNGYWIEVSREPGISSLPPPGPGMPPRPPTLGALRLELYTFNQSALKSLIREAKRNYMESSKKRVIVRSLGHPPGVPQPIGVNPPIGWGLVRIKTCRPLDSVVLPKGLLEMIVADARNFISSEDWYVRAGIPYRRGYLFYGAPGTGKTSTIYALAGALGLEIYSLSLAADKLTDTTLKSVVSRIPKRGILLIEDIDCAFTSREDEEEEASNVSSALIKHIQPSPMIGVRPPLKPQPTNVTMSGLLNVLDGVESDEGKIFMATTNYVDRLDPALIRPGRLDLKVKYELADRHQITSLFNRFFSPPDEDEPEESAEKFRNDQSITYVAKASQHPLAEEFGDLIPEGEFSIAELQGFLLSCRHDPQVAVDKAHAWVETERTERADRELKESERKQKLDEKRQARDLLVVQAVANASSVILPKPVVPSTTGSSSSSSSSDSSTSSSTS